MYYIYTLYYWSSYYLNIYFKQFLLKKLQLLIRKYEISWDPLLQHLEGPCSVLRVKSNIIRNGSRAEVFHFTYDALCPFYNSVLVSVLPGNVTFSCTLSGMLAHYGSNTNRFSQRPIHILHVSSTLVVGYPGNSVSVF